MSTSVAYIVHKIPLLENPPKEKSWHSNIRNKKYYCIVLIVQQYDCALLWLVTHVYKGFQKK